MDKAAMGHDGSMIVEEADLVDAGLFQLTFLAFSMTQLAFQYHKDIDGYRTSPLCVLQQ